jgi:hypothetical protein
MTYHKLWTELTRDEHSPELSTIEHIIHNSQALPHDVSKLHSNNRQDSLLHTALLYNIDVRIVKVLVFHFPLMLYAKNNLGHTPLHLGVLIHNTNAPAYTIILERFYKEYDTPHPNSLQTPVLRLFQNLDQILSFLGQQYVSAPSKFNTDLFPPEMVYDAIAGECELNTIDCIMMCNPSAVTKFNVTNTGGRPNPYGMLIHWAVTRMQKDSEYNLDVLRLILENSDEWTASFDTTLMPTPLQIALRNPNTPQIARILQEENEDFIAASYPSRSHQTPSASCVSDKTYSELYKQMWGGSDSK